MVQLRVIMVTVGLMIMYILHDVLQEKAFLGHLTLRGDPAQPGFAEGVEAALGLALPGAPAEAGCFARIASRCACEMFCEGKSRHSAAQG